MSTRDRGLTRRPTRDERRHSLSGSRTVNQAIGPGARHSSWPNVATGWHLGHDGDMAASAYANSNWRQSMLRSSSSELQHGMPWRRNCLSLVIMLVLLTV